MISLRFYQAEFSSCMSSQIILQNVSAKTFWNLGPKLNLFATFLSRVKRFVHESKLHSDFYVHTCDTFQEYSIEYKKDWLSHWKWARQSIDSSSFIHRPHHFCDQTIMLALKLVLSCFFDSICVCYVNSNRVRAETRRRWIYNQASKPLRPKDKRTDEEVRKCQLLSHSGSDRSMR